MKMIRLRKTMIWMANSSQTTRTQGVHRRNGRIGHNARLHAAAVTRKDAAVGLTFPDAKTDPSRYKRGSATGHRARFQVRSITLYRHWINQTSNVSDYCYEKPMECEQRRSARRLQPGEVRNMWFYNEENSRCQVFTWTCGIHQNRFKSLEKCEAHCATGHTNEMLNQPPDETETATASNEEEQVQDTYSRRTNQPRGRWTGWFLK